MKINLPRAHRWTRVGTRVKPLVPQTPGAIGGATWASVAIAFARKRKIEITDARKIHASDEVGKPSLPSRAFIARRLEGGGEKFFRSLLSVAHNEMRDATRPRSEERRVGKEGR